MSGDGKKVGVIGGLIAALGGVLAHGADDCARVGARGVAAEAAGVKAVGNVGDDLARAGVRGGSRVGGELGPGALGRGRLPAAPLVVPGAADDLGRAGARAAGFEAEVGLAAVGDEVASGAKPWKSLAEELGQEVSVDVLSELLEADEETAKSPVAAPPTWSFARIALMPGFDGFTLPRTSQALFDAIARSPSRVAVVVGNLGEPSALELTGSRVPLALSTLHARAAAAGATVWVLGCAASAEPRTLCALDARKVVEEASAARPANAAELGRELVRARDRARLSSLSIHGIARAKARPRLVHSEL
ncbi:MAG: hypothetical protein IPM35_31545 [Myxococcales bacterium]|nr:hypothetical protein [Myxococcales bacterium]